jgi:hypothetical protein
LSIEGLLKGILGGALGQQSNGQQGGELIDLLGSILGGQTTTPQQRGQQMPQQGADLSDLIGSILGGGQASRSSGGILEGILGGGQAGGDLSGILGSILGGSNMSNNAVLSPIIQALSERLGLPSGIAQAVVLFAVTTVIPALMRGLASKSGDSSPAQSRALPSMGATADGLDLDDLLRRMGTHQELGRDYLRSSGLAQQLASQTGLDPETATKSLQQTFLMLGNYLDDDAPDASGQQSGSSQGLQGLLDTWDRR